MSKRAVFLDRDGTLIVEKVYLSDPDGIEVVPGTFEAIRLLRAAGLLLITVTNQSGIGRGYYTEADYHAVAGALNRLLAEADASVDDTFFCPHHPDVTGPCDCRKPGAGMYRRAAEKHGIDLASSYYVGDKLTDVLVTREVGGRGVLVRTGYGAELEAQAPPDVWIVDDVLEAARRIAADASSG